MILQTDTLKCSLSMIFPKPMKNESMKVLPKNTSKQYFIQVIKKGNLPQLGCIKWLRPQQVTTKKDQLLGCVATRQRHGPRSEATEETTRVATPM